MKDLGEVKAVENGWVTYCEAMYKEELPEDHVLEAARQSFYAGISYYRALQTQLAKESHETYMNGMKLIENELNEFGISMSLSSIELEN